MIYEFLSCMTFFPLKKEIKHEVGGKEKILLPYNKPKF